MSLDWDKYGTNHKIIKQHDHITLSSGHQFKANGTVVGIGEDLRVTEGWDGGIAEANADGLEDTDNWSPEECRELADMMIDRWTRYREEYGEDHDMVRTPSE